VQTKVRVLESELRDSLEERNTLQCKLDDARSAMVTTSEDLVGLGQLSAWLIMRVLDVEVSEKASHIIWRSNEVNLLESCWKILISPSYFCILS